MNRHLAYAALLLAALPATARAAGDSDNGRRIAEAWCSSCHAVGQPRSANDAAPPFATIAARHDRSESWLRAWLSDPHPPMPNPGLSRQNIEDVIAYLQRLGANR